MFATACGLTGISIRIRICVCNNFSVPVRPGLDRMNSDKCLYAFRCIFGSLGRQDYGDRFAAPKFYIGNRGTVSARTIQLDVFLTSGYCQDLYVRKVPAADCTTLNYYALKNGSFVLSVLLLFFCWLVGMFVQARFQTPLSSVSLSVSSPTAGINTYFGQFIRRALRHLSGYSFGALFEN